MTEDRAPAEIQGTHQQKLVFLSTHWGSKYSFAAPEAPGAQWKAKPRFGQHDQILGWTATELLEEVRRHYESNRPKAGLLQRELAHKVGYSRSRVAGAEAGDYVSQQFCERCDAVLGTKLAHGYAVIREPRTQRLLASLAAEDGGKEPGELWERPATAWQERLSPPGPGSDDLRIKVLAGFIGGVWHIEIHLPAAQPVQRTAISTSPETRERMTA